MKVYYVYILASAKHGTLYIGVSNSLRHRTYQHQMGEGSKFTAKYNIDKLVYVEEYATPIEAITREKQLKKWKRAWKIKLIESQNPEWNDLYLHIN